MLFGVNIGFRVSSYLLDEVSEFDKPIRLQISILYSTGLFFQLDCLIITIIIIRSTVYHVLQNECHDENGNRQMLEHCHTSLKDQWCL